MCIFFYTCNGNGHREKTGSGVLLMGPEGEESTCGGGGSILWGNLCPGSDTKQAQRIEPFLMSWTRESIPFSVCLCESQKPHHPGGSSEPLGDLSSHPAHLVWVLVGAASVWTLWQPTAHLQSTPVSLPTGTPSLPQN